MESFNWKRTVLLACVVALAIDPLFLFIPMIDSHRFCFTFDKKLGVTVSVLRTFIDTFYVLHIIYNLITKVISPRSHLEDWVGEWRLHSKARRKKRLLFYFIVDFLFVLPIPQVVVLVLSQQSAALVSKEILKWTILSQYLPRIIRIYLLLTEMIRFYGKVAESMWIGAVLNLFLYMLHSYGFGALWYVSAIEKKSQCSHDACARTSGCNLTDLFCRRGGGDNSRFLNTTCPLIDPDQITNSTVFNFGMFIDAFKSGVVEVEPRDLPRKFIYCFWWGLRNMSALGQNLETSNSAGEIFFAVIICLSGLVLFAVLIGNVQKYLQSSSRVDELEEKRRDTEKWMSYRKLPEGLKESIRRYGDFKWRETRGTEEEALLHSLPKHLRKGIKRHLCLHLLRQVPMFEVMDDRLLDILCSHLKTAHYTEDSYIVREGEPVEDMLFIMRGKLKSSTTNSGQIGFFNSVLLKAGDFCGEELIIWGFDPRSSHYPFSSRTVQALTEVEGFLLSADDLKLVSAQCRPLHSKKLQHLFRYYSLQWRTWATCFIQAAWRTYCRRKLSKALREEESKLHNTLLNDDSRDNKFNLGAAIHASRFASHALRNLRTNAATRNSRFPRKLSLSKNLKKKL